MLLQPGPAVEGGDGAVGRERHLRGLLQRLGGVHGGRECGRLAGEHAGRAGEAAGQSPPHPRPPPRALRSNQGGDSNDKSFITKIKHGSAVQLADMEKKPKVCREVWPYLCSCLTANNRPSLVELRNQYEQQLLELAAEMR